MKKANLIAIYINLESSEGRRAFMENQLSKLNIPFNRFSAINGSKLPKNISQINPKDFSRFHGREVRVGEIGCYLSHIGALKQFLESNAKFGLILEDDALISEEARNIIQKIINNYKEGDWDFLKLQSRRNTKVIKTHKIDKKYSLAISFTRSTGATAYIVNRFAAKQMIEKLFPIETPYDHAFDRPLFLNIRVRAVFPYPIKLVKEHSNCSTIETSKAIKRRGFKKLNALFWRAKSEITRITWAVSEVAKDIFTKTFIFRK